MRNRPIRTRTNSPRLPARTLMLIAAFTASFQAVAAAPASLLPAFAGLSRAGVRYEAARGSLWNGSLVGVDALGLRLGAVDFELAPLALFAGRAVVAFRISGGAVEGEGRLRLNFLGGGALTATRLTFDPAAARRHAVVDELLDGGVRAEVDRLAFSSAGCADGAVRIATDIASAPARRSGGRGFGLSGAGRCDNGDLVVDLAGEGEDGAASLAIRLSPARTYSIAAIVSPAREEIADALAALGFERRNGELAFDADGTIGSIGS